MPKPSPSAGNAPAYAHGVPYLPGEPEDMAGQLRHLAKIGIAALDSNTTLPNMDASFEALFEVMAHVASLLEDELDQRGRFSGKRSGGAD